MYAFDGLVRLTSVKVPREMKRKNENNVKRLAQLIIVSIAVRSFRCFASSAAVWLPSEADDDHEARPDMSFPSFLAPT